MFLTCDPFCTLPRVKNNVNNNAIINEKKNLEKKRDAWLTDLEFLLRAFEPFSKVLGSNKTSTQLQRGKRDNYLFFIFFENRVVTREKE